MQVIVGDFVRPEYLHYLSQTGVMEAGESVDVFISTLSHIGAQIVHNCYKVSEPYRSTDSTQLL